MKETQNTRTSMIKKMLRTSLFELIKDKSIHKISIKEICEKAGINRSTFYNYYFDEYAVLKDIEREEYEEMNSHLGDFFGATEDYLVELLRYIRNNIDRLSPLFFNSECENFKKLFFNGTERLLQNIKEKDSEGYDFLLTFVTNGNWAILIKWIKDKFPISESELSKLLFKYNQALLD